ncbi:MAG: hypothetical protein JNM72_06925 [Deltaproteobacteria bacterium]|nr:hypothetical protein [Deltaproteobacteria bacterium]
MARKPLTATTPPWELLLLPLVPGDSSRLLVIADARSGALRHLELHSDRAPPRALAEALGRAAASPTVSGQKVGRPRSVACPPDQLAEVQVALKALGVVAHSAAAVPAARKWADELRPVPPSLTNTLGRAAVLGPAEGWAQALAALLRARPWDRDLEDAFIRFSSADPQLHNLVVQVIDGMDAQSVWGPIPGLIIYPGPEAARRAQTAGLRGRDMVDGVILRVEQKDGLGSLVGDWALESGRVLEGRVLTGRLRLEGEVTPLREALYGSVQAVCRAVAALFEAHPDALPEAEAPWAWPERPDTTLWVAQTLLPLAAHAGPARLPLAVRPPQAAAEPDGGARLTLFIAPENVGVALPILSQLVALEARPDALGNWELSGVDASGAPSTIAGVPLPMLPPSAFDGQLDLELAEASPDGRVPARPLVPWSARLPITLRGWTGALLSTLMDEPDPLGLLKGFGWDGPPATWPKSSDVVLSLVGPLLTPSPAAGAVRRLANAAARLWTLEHRGLSLDRAAQDPQLCALLGAPLAAALAARKARHFALDRRPITVRGVRVLDGQVHLDTAWVTEAPR